MKDENYVVIQGWMVNKLNLSGNELMVYAIIYGFSQDGESEYEGSGKYLADSCNISRRSVSLILNSLTEKNYIIKSDYFQNGIKFCKYSVNFDFLSKLGMEKISIGRKNFPNNCKKNDPGGMENISIPRKNDPGGMENSSIGDRKNFPQGMENISNNITNINILDTTTTIPQDSTAQPLPTVDKVVADSFLSSKDLKEALISIDKRLIYDKAFYSRAASYLAEKGLGMDFLSWLRNYCEKQDYRSFKGLFYSLSFKENMIEEYFAAQVSDEPEVKPLPPDKICPACNKSHALDLKECPSCGLPDSDALNPERVLIFKQLHFFYPDKKDEFFDREYNIIRKYNSHYDYNKRHSMLADLYQEFGISS